MPLIVRPARVEDLPAVLDLYDFLITDVSRFYVGEERLSAEQAEAVFRHMHDERGDVLLVAERDGRIVGTVFLAFFPNLTHEGRPGAVVENMVVHPDFRRFGVGAALLREVDRQARLRNAPKVSLTSNAIRHGAHQFYEALGWTRTHYGYTLTVRPDAPASSG